MFFYVFTFLCFVTFSFFYILQKMTFIFITFYVTFTDVIHRVTFYVLKLLHFILMRFDELNNVLCGFLHCMFLH
jgi:hypothetical protein